MSVDPPTLFEQPAAVLPDGGIQLDPRAPEWIKQFANQKLQERGIDTTKKRCDAMRNKNDRVAHDAAWLKEHSMDALGLIKSASEEQKGTLRAMWMLGFHAGARHENITSELMHYPQAVSAVKRQAIARAAGQPKKAAQQRSGTEKKLADAEKKAARGRKGMGLLKDVAHIAGVSVRTVSMYRREKKHLASQYTRAKLGSKP